MAKKDLETLPNWRDAFNSPTTVRNQRTKDNVGILLYAYTPVLVIFQDVTKSLFGWPAKQFDCVIELYGTLGPISLLELLTAVRTISSAFFQIMMVWMNFCIIWYDIAVIPGYGRLSSADLHILPPIPDDDDHQQQHQQNIVIIINECIGLWSAGIDLLKISRGHWLCKKAINSVHFWFPFTLPIVRADKSKLDFWIAPNNTFIQSTFSYFYYWQFVIIIFSGTGVCLSRHFHCKVLWSIPTPLKHLELLIKRSWSIQLEDRYSLFYMTYDLLSAIG